MRVHVKSLPLDRQQKLLDEYALHQNVAKLARDWEIDPRTIRKFLRRKKIYVEPTQHVELDVDLSAKLYEAGVPICEIAKRLQSTHRNVKNALLKKGVRLCGNRWYSYDDTYFSSVDTEQKAYWLGFLYADGNVYTDNNKINSVTVKLSTIDESHLRKLAEHLKYNGPIKIRTRSSKFPNGSVGKYTTAQLKITSKNMVRDLTNSGCVPKKSLTLSFPDKHVLPEELRSHFIRGYFDGDGCMSVNKSGVTFSMLGTHRFLIDIQNVLINNVGVSKTKIGRKKRIHHLTYGGRLQCKAIGEYLYKNATVWLDRKRQKFDQLSS